MSGSTERPLRVLFAPETFNLGETSRGVEVARAMRTAGHDILFMGYSRRFAAYVRDAGFELELLDPELSEKDADRLIAVDQGRAIRHPFSTDMVRRRVASELALIERWRPDAIVIGTTLTLLVSARVAKVPLVYIRPYAMSRSHLVAVQTFPVTAGSGRWSAGVDRLAGASIRGLLGRLRWKPHSFRAVAAEHALGLPSLTLDALDADLNLIASTFPAIDDRPLSPRDRVVGPVYARPGGELPEEVRAIRERGRPVVYLGLGSSANRRLALALTRQLSQMEIEVIGGIGRYLSARDRAGLPANVHVFDFLPAHLLAGLIDASVIHGGEGTVQAACASGVPFAGIGLQPEQRHNIDECVRYGNALRITKRDVRQGTVPALVERLLVDPALRGSAVRLRQRLRPIDGAAASARWIERAARRFLEAGVEVRDDDPGD